MLTTAPRGTKDVLPQESYKWQFVEQMFRDICKNFGYSEVRTPVFEHTELFMRGVGQTTDIVQKEMYIFNDKKNRSLTLKPEGTAGVARAYIENKLYSESPYQKMYYITPAFRYERPQSGRYREFHQFGIEMFGSENAATDAEVISLAMSFFKKLKVRGLELNINSIGCPKCRAEYNKALKEYFKANYDELCPDCKERYEKNPLRLLDCKVDRCKEIGKAAPAILDYLCDDCKVHFDELQESLNALGIEYKIDPRIVRGLDYYTRTVFEIITNEIGTQGTVCGGGRYNGLVEECGGPQTPAVGFGIGIERLLIVLEAQGIYAGEKPVPQIYLGAIGENAQKEAFKIVYALRNNGISAEFDHMKKSVKAQMKLADKIGAKYTAILGDNEIETKTINIKNMQNGETKEISLDALINWREI